MTCTHTVIVDAYGDTATKTLCAMSHGALPYTGLDLAIFLIVGAALVALGTAMLTITRSKS